MLIIPWENIDKEPDNPFNEYRIPPPIIYHYTSIDTAALIVGNQTLKFAPPPEFNDPLDMYEGLVTYQADSRTIRTWIRRNFPLLTSKRRRTMEHLVLTRPEAAEKFKGALTKIKLHSGVCCFSKVPDQVLMWSHYAQKHRGVCFGFNIQPIRKKEDFVVFDVNYVDAVTSANFFTEREKILRHWALTKSTAWAYEQEVRAIIRDTKFQRYIKFDKACLKEVFFGCATPPADVNRINTLLAEHGFTNLVKKQLQIDQETFGLKAIAL